MYRHYRPPATYSLAEARRAIRQAMEATAELRRDADTLPPVRADGSTECPCAETLFFKKERTAQFVRDDLQELQRFLESCTTHIRIAQNKIHDLAYQREALHGDAAQDQFAKAELLLGNEMRSHQQLRRDLRDSIAEVEATLREAGLKQCPDGEPRGPFGQRIYSEPQVPQSLAELTKNNAKEQVDRILRETKDL